MIAPGSVLRVRGRKVRVHGYDGLRQVVLVYGRRDVVAWPVTVLELRRAAS